MGVIVYYLYKYTRKKETNLNQLQPLRSPRLSCPAPITDLVGGNFRLPVGQPALGQPAVAARMPMPETPVIENDFPSVHESQIRFSWQIASRKGVAVSKPMNHRPDGLLRTGVACANRAMILLRIALVTRSMLASDPASAIRISEATPPDDTVESAAASLLHCGRRGQACRWLCRGWQRHQKVPLAGRLRRV